MEVLAFTAIDYENLMPLVRASTRGCPDPIRTIQLQHAVNEFCRRSRFWRQRNTAILTTVAGQALYPVALTTSGVAITGVELVQLHSTWNDGSEIPLPQPGEDDDAAPGATVDTPDVPDWNDDNSFLSTGPFWNNQSPTGWKVYTDSLEMLSIAPIPDTDGQAVVGTVSFAPTLDATSLPSFIYSEWRDEIAAGAVALLCKEPGKPWSDPMTADDMRKTFEKAILRASAKRGPVKRAPLRVRPSKV